MPLQQPLAAQERGKQQTISAWCIWNIQTTTKCEKIRKWITSVMGTRPKHSIHLLLLTSYSNQGNYRVILAVVKQILFKPHAVLLS